MTWRLARERSRRPRRRARFFAGRSRRGDAIGVGTDRRGRRSVGFGRRARRRRRGGGAREDGRGGGGGDVARGRSGTRVGGGTRRAASGRGGGEAPTRRRKRRRMTVRDEGRRAGRSDGRGVIGRAWALSRRLLSSGASRETIAERRVSLLSVLSVLSRVSSRRNRDSVTTDSAASTADAAPNPTYNLSLRSARRSIRFNRSASGGANRSLEKSGAAPRLPSSRPPKRPARAPRCSPCSAPSVGIPANHTSAVPNTPSADIARNTLFCSLRSMLMRMRAALAEDAEDGVGAPVEARCSGRRR